MSLTFDEVRERVALDDRNKVDTVVSMNSIRMTDEGHIKVGGNTMRLSDHGFTQALTKLGMPVRYMKKAQSENPELLQDHFNHWAGQDKRRVLVRYREIGGEAVVRGVLSDDYTRLDNIHVIDAMSRVLDRMPDTQFQSFYLDDEMLHLRMVIPKLSSIVGKTVDGKDDVLAVGSDLVNSEIGLRSVEVSPQVFRQWCTNGARAWFLDGDIFRQRHIHLSPEELYARMNGAVIQGIEGGDKLLHYMNSAHEIKVENPLDVIEKLAQKAEYSKDIAHGVQMAFGEDPQDSLYGVGNAFTRYARDLRIDLRLDMERFGGRLFEDPSLLPKN